MDLNDFFKRICTLDIIFTRLFLILSHVNVELHSKIIYKRVVLFCNDSILFKLILNALWFNDKFNGVEKS